MFLVRNESMKSDPAEEQSIDSGETPLPRSVLNLAGAPQGTNSVGVLSARSKSRDKCLGSVSNSIDYIQIKIFHLKLTSIIKRSSDQTERT